MILIIKLQSAYAEMPFAQPMVYLKAFVSKEIKLGIKSSDNNINNNNYLPKDDDTDYRYNNI